MSQGPWTAQFSVSQGRVQERSSSLFVLEQGGTRRRPNIYILTESDPPGDADACRLVANTVAERIRTRRGPLTTALGDGLRVAHGRLIATPSRASDRSRRSPSGKSQIGVSCAVLSDNEVYFAQAGPAQAFIFGQDGVARLAPDAGGETAPLGGDRTPTVTLHRHTLGEGDFVLLSSPQLPSRLRAQELPLLAGLSPEEAVRGLYVASQGERSYSAILFGLQSAPPILELPQPFPHMTPVRPSPLAEGRRLPRLSLGWSWPTVSRLARLPLLVVALALGVVLVGNATSLANQVSASQTDDRFATLVRQAEQQRNAGMAAADLTQQRVLLKQADRMLGEALGLRPDDRRATSIRADIAATLARLNAVFELTDLALLLDFRRLGRGVGRLEDFWVVDKSAYLLDFESDMLYRFPVDPLPAAGRENDALETVIGKGAPAGTPQPRRVVAMAYVPSPSAGKVGSFVVLDDSRNAIGYTPGGKAREIVVRGAATWGELRAAAGFNGNLYILDAKARQVLRYAPTDNGFDSEWKSVLDAAAPADARDLAIDGSIYILAASGQIQRFGAGAPQTLKQDGIDEPLSNPTAIFAAASGRYLYVADGARRIVVFTKEGKFYRQFPLPATVGAPPYGLFVDEAQGKLYITSEGRLYRASLRI